MRIHISILILGLLFITMLAEMGCTGSSTYHRSALTPLPQPALTGAGNFRGRSQLTVGTTLSSTVRAHEGTNPEEVNPDGESVSFSDGEANWVPRTQANLIFKHKFGRYFAMGLLGELAVNTGAVKTYSDSVDLRPKGNALGLGLTFQFLLPINHQWHIGVGTDLLIYDVPYVKMATSSTNPGSADLWVPHYDSEIVGVGAFYIIPSYKLPWGSLYGGLTIRNHPTAPKVQTESNVLGDSNVDEGDAYYVLSFGAQIHLSHNLSLQVMVMQPLTRYPVTYYPMGLVGITWDIDAPPAVLQ